MSIFVDQMKRNMISNWFWLIFNFFQTMPSLLLQQLDRRSGQHSDRPQMRATPPPSPSTIMTLLATCQSTLSLFPRSLSMRHHSVISLPSCMDLPYQPLLLVPGKHPATLSTTVPHTGCYLMATALLLYMPMAQDQWVRFTLSLSHVTLYYRSTHMKGLCEYSKLKHGEKTLWAKAWVGTRGPLGVIWSGH